MQEDLQSVIVTGISHDFRLSQQLLGGSPGNDVRRELLVLEVAEKMLMPAAKLKENGLLVWKDQVENFELRLKFRLEGGKSGIYYHSANYSGSAAGNPTIGR